MSTKQYVKNYKEQMQEIMSHLSAIDKVISGLPETASWTTSLKTSQVNYVKKVESFLATSEELTESQKNAIRAIKSGKLTEEEVSSLSARVEKSKPATSAGGSKQEQTKKASVKGKKN